MISTGVSTGSFNLPKERLVATRGNPVASILPDATCFEDVSQDMSVRNGNHPNTVRKHTHRPMPKCLSDRVNKYAPQRKSKQMSKHMSKHKSKHMSKHMSKHTAEHKSRHMFRHMFRHMSRHMSKYMSEHMCLDISKHMSEHMSKHMFRHMFEHMFKHVSKCMSNYISKHMYAHMQGIIKTEDFSETPDLYAFGMVCHSYRVHSYVLYNP